MSVKCRLSSSIFILLLCFISKISACSHRISLSKNDSYILNLPNYSNQYPQRTSCYYTISAPEGYGVDVECNITMKSNHCTTEYFSISNTDDPNFEHGEQFCRTQTVRRSSRFQAITVGYFLNIARETGSLQCHFTSSPQPCDCGWNFDTKIVGGHEVKPNQYPFMAGILTRELHLFCDGSIISQQFILTAAHCAINRNATSLFVLVGDHDLNSRVDSEYTQMVHVKDAIIHEKYSQADIINDIALLRTSRLKWSLGVGPVCLPFLYRSRDFKGLTVQVVGWGKQLFGVNDTSGVLLEGAVEVLSARDCEKDSLILCTFSSNGTDACQGDSGGPVVASFSRMFTVGIIASGVECDGLGFNTRVTSFLGWILEKTQENFCSKHF